MKKMRKFFLVILAIVALLVIARNVIVKNAVSAGVKAVTGLQLDIKRMNIGFIKTLIGIEGLKLYNPAGYKDPVMVDIPEVYVDYNLGAFLKKKVHLKEVRLNLKEFVVVKNEKGELNLDSLKAVQSAKEKKEPSPKKEKGAIPEFKIDLLRLKIGKVVYKDYSKGDKPKVSEYNINIDEEFKNITDPQALGQLIVAKAVMNTALARITGFDLGSLTDSLGSTLDTTKEAISNLIGVGKGAGSKATESTKEAVAKATEAIKKIFPGGKVILSTEDK